MASFSYYCRQSKINRLGYAPIELSIMIDSKRCFINLDRKEKPDVFSKLLKQKKNSDLREYLDAMNNTINKAITNINKDGETLTTDTLRQYIKYGGAKIYTVEDLFNDFFKILYVKAEECNIKKYAIVREEFYEFIGSKTTPLTNITNATIQAFYAQTYKRFKHSTAAGKIAKLKCIFKFALDNAKITINPFSTIKISKPRGTVEYLTDEEVETIRNHQFSTDRLNYVRDLFIFQCGSGLSYADMSSLRAEDVQVEENTYYIIKNRQKTDITFTSVLLPYAIEVLNKHNGTLPIISNQKMNAYLKEIGDLCGITKNLHSHLARKTYATHLINSGARMEVVSKCCGHANTKITAAIYAHLQTKTIINEVTKIL